jgi:hypothetical protein
MSGKFAAEPLSESGRYNFSSPFGVDDKIAVDDQVEFIV